MCSGTQRNRQVLHCQWSVTETTLNRISIRPADVHSLGGKTDEYANMKKLE